MAIAVVLYTGFALYVGFSLSHNQLINPEELALKVARAPIIFQNKIHGFLYGQSPRLAIDIKHQDFQWLAYKREEAMTLGRLVSDDDDLVPARIRHGDREISAKVRLKGDLLDHLDTEKWSLRVKIKGNETLWGMQSFSIQHPKTRNYLAETLYQLALTEEDILTPRSELVRVSLNGKDMGIYLMQEHFEKQLIEDRKRREGLIVRYSEEDFWRHWSYYDTFPAALLTSEASFSSSNIEAYQMKSIVEDSSRYAMFLKAMSLLREFQRGNLAAHDVFDVEKMAMYLALSELLGAVHSASWRNMRFYYNPITTRLEPIGYDADGGFKLDRSWATWTAQQELDQYTELLSQALPDPAFFAPYLKALGRVSHKEYLERLLVKTQPTLNQQLNILHREFPDYELPIENLEYNQRFLQYILNPTEGLRAHLLHHRADSLFLEIGATQAIPMKILGLQWEDSLFVKTGSLRIVPGKKEEHGVVFDQIAFPIPYGVVVNDSTLTGLSVSYKLLGSDSLRQVSIVPHPSYVQEYVEGDLTREPANTDRFPFLIRNDNTQTIFAESGTWTLSEPLILPKGYLFRAGPGTSINLTQSALILARGSLEWIGQSDAPIRLFSTDSTGQGLVVMNADQESVFNHVEFENLQSADHKAWALTGAVTFHESPVRFKNTSFFNSHSEDALNIVRSSFAMDSVRFENTSSDAFDADFTTGQIRNSVFTKCINDGIDVSGSEIKIENVIISDAGDKALSAGEFSVLHGNNVTILTSEIAVASKDQSKVHLSNGNISDSRVGFAIFQKKPEYGPATAEIDDVRLQDIITPTLLEEGSHLFLNGNRIAPTHPNVSDMLYGNLYGRASE